MPDDKKPNLDPSFELAWNISFAVNSFKDANNTAENMMSTINAMMKNDYILPSGSEVQDMFKNLSIYTAMVEAPMKNIMETFGDNPNMLDIYNKTSTLTTDECAILDEDANRIITVCNIVRICGDIIDKMREISDDFKELKEYGDFKKF